MASKTSNITKVTRGSDVTIEFSITSALPITQARFIVKTAPKKDDSAALIDKTVTTTLTSSGQITGAGPYLVAVILTQADTAACKAGVNYAYDLEVFDASDKATTPVGGTFILEQRVRIATGV